MDWYQRTFELALEVLFGCKSPLARVFIAKKAISKSVHHVNDLLCTVIKIFVCLFRGRVGANIEILATFGHLSAIDFINNIVLLNELIGIRDDLIAGDDVLWRNTC